MSNINWVENVAEDLRAKELLLNYKKDWADGKFNRTMSLSEYVQCMETLKNHRRIN